MECVTWSVVFFLDCCNRMPQTTWLLNNRSLFIIVLKVEKSETHVLGTHSAEGQLRILGLPGVSELLFLLCDKTYGRKKVCFGSQLSVVESAQLHVSIVEENESPHSGQEPEGQAFLPPLQ